MLKEDKSTKIVLIVVLVLSVVAIGGLVGMFLYDNSTEKQTEKACKDELYGEEGFKMAFEGGKFHIVEANINYDMCTFDVDGVSITSVLEAYVTKGSVIRSEVTKFDSTEGVHNVMPSMVRNSLKENALGLNVKMHTNRIVVGDTAKNVSNLSVMRKNGVSYIDDYDCSSYSSGDYAYSSGVFAKDNGDGSLDAFYIRPVANCSDNVYLFMQIDGSTIKDCIVFMDYTRAEVNELVRDYVKDNIIILK